MLPYILVAIVLLAYLLGELFLLLGTAPQPGRIGRLYVTTGSGGGTTCNVEYHYVVGTSIYGGTDAVSRPFYSNLKVGMDVNVHVLTIGPFQFREMEKSSSEYWGTHWFLWLSAILWCGVLLLTLKARGIPRRLVRNGTPVMGRIAEIKAPRPGSNTVQLFYEFSNGAGQKITANDVVSKGRSGRISQGQEVVVLYDPAMPRRAILYDFCDYKAG